MNNLFLNAEKINKDVIMKCEECGETEYDYVVFKDNPPEQFVAKAVIICKCGGEFK